MSVHFLLFSMGVIAVSFFSQLPPAIFLLVLAPLLFLSQCYQRFLPFTTFMLGIGWGIYSGHTIIDSQLDDELVGKDLQILGVITDLPEHTDARLRFNVSIRAAMTADGKPLELSEFPAKVQLSWYPAYSKTKNAAPPIPGVGQIWQLHVRLKRPRGFANPAGFDYQAWLLRQSVGATGYVLDRPDNIQQQEFSISRGWREWIDHQRQLLQQWIVKENNSTERGILIALLIGDSSYVEKAQWDRMQQTGTSHLIAISGLHVGFLALFGFYLGLGIGKCVQLFWRACPALIIAWLTAIACASFYSALAGFNIPTVRTLIMLGLFYLACLLQRSIRMGDIFCCALVIVLIIDPLAAYDMGFWLSFGAVALLLFYFSGRRVHKPVADDWQRFSISSMLSGFVRSQWVMFIGLLVPLSILVHSVSLVAPIANAIAIPLITFFVVPLLLMSAAFQNLIPVASDFLLNAAAVALELLKIILEKSLALAGDYASPIVSVTPGLAILIGCSCLILLMPNGLLPKVLGWGGIFLGVTLAYAVPTPNIPALKLTVLDVGQGTAAVVQVNNKTLVYDTGPQFTPSFDAGGAILAPYLFSQGISRVDTLVVSHQDSDHAGGLNSFLEKVNIHKLLLGDKATSIDPSYIIQPESCHEQTPWVWDDVSFEFLSFPISGYTSNNNKSCVLLIHYGDQTILLPGDIETRVENWLLNENKIPANLSVLLAAHHGSRTSSSARFVNLTKPGVVIYSAGYRSQHGHPHPLVRKRFQNIGSRELTTAESGALVLVWYPNSAPLIYESRKIQRRYWFD
ncbi:MAG TPA: DNA internalization-related competence protein ComEC/Rec2 [Cellvibrio sp.]|nr:DNA internalization-related competence protein ComEC/Rec2 [Cellvibrio sp.]